MRRLTSAFSSNAIRVRRSNDDAELDINFTTGGQLDIVALKFFVGSNDGYITTWYDQSGNSNHAVQPIFNNQPRIVSGGIVDLVNGVPSVSFDGGNDFLSLTSFPLVGSTNATVSFVFQINTPQLGAPHFDIGANVSTKMSAIPNFNGSVGGFGITIGSNQGTTFLATTDNINHTIMYNHYGTSVDVSRDRVTIGGVGGITFVPNDVVGSNNFIGKNQDSTIWYSGNIQEIIFFQTNLNVSAQRSVQYNQQTWFSTP